MSTTPEQMRRELEEFKAQRQMRQELASFRAALQAGGQPGEAAPVAPEPDERTFMERLQQTGAAMAEPILETLLGAQELQPDPFGAMPKRIERTRRGLERMRELSAQAPPGARAVDRVLGETAMMLLPASKAYRAGQALRGLPGVRSRMTRAAAPLAAETGVVAGMEALKSPEATGVPRAEAARDVALANVAGAGLQRALRKPFLPGQFQRTPIAEAEAQALRDAGIEPRIPISAEGVEGRQAGSIARWLHRRPLASIPPTQAVVRGQQEAALSDWRDMMFQQAVPEGAGIRAPSAREGSLKPVRDTFADIDDWYSREYKEVLDPYAFDVQGERGLVGAAIDQAVQDVPGEASRRVVQNKMSELLADMSDSGGRLTGSKVSQLKKILRKQASRVDVDPEVATGYRDVIDALDDSVEQSIRAVNPGHADRLKALRAPYRNFVVMEDAAKGRVGGKFEPEDLLRASERKMTQEKRPSERAAGRGPLQAEAERAVQTYNFPGKGSEESNIFQLAALGGTAVPAVAGGLPGVVASGAVWAPTVAGLSRGGTRYMSNEARWQRYLQDMMQSTGFQEFSRAARIGGAQLATD